MKKFQRGILEEIGIEMSDMMGRLKDGTPWKLSPWNGDFLVKDDEGDWEVPVWNRKYDEIGPLGNTCEAAEKMAEAWGEEYGKNWASPEFWDDETFETNIRHAAEFARGYITWPEFQQFLTNACLYGQADQEEAQKQLFTPYEGDDADVIEEWEWWTRTAIQPDGWLGQFILDAAQDAAYKETLRRAAELAELDEEDENA